MKTLKIIGFLFLIGIVILLVCNLGPVWLQRLVGFNGYSSNVFHPQWINNEEYCYLQVESYFDYGMGFTGIHEDFYNPLKKRSSNATFSIYKVNIKNPGDEQLIKRITRKVRFKIAPELKRIFEKGNFIFKSLDNDNLTLLIKGVSQYSFYTINQDGAIVSKKMISLPMGKDPIDISSDGKYILVWDVGQIYLKSIESGSLEKVNMKSKVRWLGFDRFLTTNEILSYRMEHNDLKSIKIVVTDFKKEDVQQIATKKFVDYDKDIVNLLLDYSYRDEVLFLSRIGIFKKQNGQWKMIKDLSDMNYCFYYPNISPDKKQVIGMTSDQAMQVIEMDKLMR